MILPKEKTYFKDSDVALSISIMLSAAGFFGLFSSFSCATSPFIFDLICTSITQPFNGLKPLPSMRDSVQLHLRKRSIFASCYYFRVASKAYFSFLFNYSTQEEINDCRDAEGRTNL